MPVKVANMVSHNVKFKDSKVVKTAPFSLKSRKGSALFITFGLTTNKWPMSAIPSVDLGDFISGDSSRKEKFVKEIGAAFEGIGFVALSGHFLSDALVEELYAEIKQIGRASCRERVTL